MKKMNNNFASFSDHLGVQYVVRRAETHEKREERIESIKLGVLLQELRKEFGMTQEQLAMKCGTTRTYISRIENNTSDIRLSTLVRIISKGFGRRLSVSVGN